MVTTSAHTAGRHARAGHDWVRLPGFAADIGVARRNVYTGTLGRRQSADLVLQTRAAGDPSFTCSLLCSICALTNGAAACDACREYVGGIRQPLRR